MSLQTRALDVIDGFDDEFPLVTNIEYLNNKPDINFKEPIKIQVGITTMTAPSRPLVFPRVDIENRHIYYYRIENPNLTTIIQPSWFTGSMSFLKLNGELSYKEPYVTFVELRTKDSLIYGCNYLTRAIPPIAAIERNDDGLIEIFIVDIDTVYIKYKQDGVYYYHHCTPNEFILINVPYIALLFTENLTKKIAAPPPPPGINIADNIPLLDGDLDPTPPPGNNNSGNIPVLDDDPPPPPSVISPPNVPAPPPLPDKTTEQTSETVEQETSENIIGRRSRSEMRNVEIIDQVIGDHMEKHNDKQKLWSIELLAIGLFVGLVLNKI